MRARRVLARIGWTLAAMVLSVVLVVGVGMVIVLRASLPTIDGAERLPGLAADVTVHRDAWGVPQIYADNAEDLFRAQGYVHAQDRFWEMDFRRHLASGRLAELFGPPVVEADQVIRTMGWRQVAEAEYPALKPSTQQYLRAYADGVNAWLGTHSGVDASLEHGMLRLTNPDYRIEPWEPVDSVVWLKAMAWDLRSNMGEELMRARLLAKGTPRDRIEQLFPGYPYTDHAPIVEGGAAVGGVFDPTATDDVSRPAATTPSAAGPTRDTEPVRDVAETLSAAADAVEQVPAGVALAGSGVGSNSWVVAGSRTATGQPLLANDPHLNPSLPSVWTQMGLHCRNRSSECPFAVTGFTFSGMPGVVIGHNDRIAWGFTNLGPDVADLYLEKVDGDSYEVAGSSRKLTSRTETIKVAGAADRTITVRATHHGPILSDVDDKMTGLGYAVALRWTALDPGRTMDAVFALNTAQNWDQFRAAAKLFSVPAQNMVYADVDGNIGYQAPGDIPIRGSGDGRWPAPGWDPAFDWTGRIPFEELPWVKNPPDGYVVTANQAVADPSYPYLLTSDWSYGYRSERIGQLIEQAGSKLTVDMMVDMQQDSRNGNAEKLVPALTGLNLTGPAAEAQKLLAGWDLSQPADSSPAALFNATWRHLLAETFDDDLPKGPPYTVDGGERWFAVVGSLLEQPSSSWWDDRETETVETRDDILGRAITLATDELVQTQGDDPHAWQWGRMHTMTLRNEAFGNSGIGPVEWLVNRGPYEVGGGNSMVNATGWTAFRGYAVDWVPSMRMVVDLADLDRSRWINLTGASGHAFDRHYTDQTLLWQRGETIPMPFTPAAVREATRHELVLHP